MCRGYAQPCQVKRSDLPLPIHFPIGLPIMPKSVEHPIGGSDDVLHSPNSGCRVLRRELQYRSVSLMDGLRRMQNPIGHVFPDLIDPDVLLAGLAIASADRRRIVPLQGRIASE